EQLQLPVLARRAGVDVLHSLASTAPTWGAFRRVVTIHDLIYRIHPEAHGWRTLALRGLIPLAARRSDRVIVPSQATRRDLVRLEGYTRFLAWVPHEELEGLYRSATIFVFPSLYEGFGLPVLEAMTRGVPVACSNRGALAEVANEAALTFDPERPQDIAAAIE